MRDGLMKLLKYLILFVLVTAGIGWLGVKDALTPIERKNTAHPIYTIGDVNYQTALKSETSILKFGKMFWGLYPGGLAFESPEAAISYMESNEHILEKFSSGWAVYELSGDYNLDTHGSSPRYLNNSMLVIRSVDKL